MWLELRAVERRFGLCRAVNGLSLDLPEGAIGCLLGPSGCGKTTALRCIAGFEPIDGGTIRAGGRLLSEPGQTLPPSQRQIGMVFQDFALFPHLRAFDNVGFGLHALSRRERQRRAEALLDSVGLREKRDQYPHQLSGGQQQRVALARALAPKPDLALLDEPFSSLDVELRERLALEVRDILKQQKTTALLVTHDQQEAFAMADIIGVMRNGRLEQWGAPHDLYHRPATRFVAMFVGQGVFIPGEIAGDDVVRTELGCLRIHDAGRWRTGAAVDVLLRPDDVSLDPESKLRAVVCHRVFRGAEFLYTLLLPTGVRLLALVPSHHTHEIGDPVGVRLAHDPMAVFDRDTAAPPPAE
jgi:iron(III) transport system ATP-binding protein